MEITRVEGKREMWRAERAGNGQLPLVMYAPVRGTLVRVAEALERKEEAEE